jgi:hypothetical protein
MKAALVITVPLIIGAIATYLTGAFAAWEWNPGNWHPGARLAAIACWPGTTALIVAWVRFIRKVSAYDPHY